MRSFKVKDTTEIKLFFREYGYVVVDNVITNSECYKTCDEIWDISGMKKNRPSTYYNWSKYGKEKQGIPSRKPIFTPNVMNNRQNENVYKVFSMLLDNEDLLSSHDTCYMTRPTKNVKFENNVIKSVKSWEIMEDDRLDMNEKKYMDGDISKLKNTSYMNTSSFVTEISEFNRFKQKYHLSGLINLVDTNCFYVNGEMIRLKARALLVWDKKLPYKIMSNVTKRCWMAQKICFMKKKFVGNLSRKNVLKQKLKEIKKHIVVTNLGYSLFGLQ